MSLFTNLRLSLVSDLDRKGKALQLEIVALSANHTGTRVFNTRLDKTIRIWKCLVLSLTDPVVVELTHLGPVTSIAWNPATDLDFATAAGDSLVKVWKSTGIVEQEFDTPADVTLVEYSADGAILAAVSQKGIFIYNQNYSLLQELKVNGVTDIKWLNQGHLMFIAATEAGNIEIYKRGVDGASFSLGNTLSGPRLVTCLLVDPRGRYIAAGSREGVVYFWRTTDMMARGVIADIDQEISGLACGRDGQYVYVGYSLEQNSRVYDSASMEFVYEVAGTAGARVAWVPNRQMIVFLEEKNKVMGFGRKDDGARDRQSGGRIEGSGRGDNGSGRGDNGSGRGDNGSGRERDRGGRDKNGNDRSDRTERGGERSERNERGDRGDRGEWRKRDRERDREREYRVRDRRR